MTDVGFMGQIYDILDAYKPLNKGYIKYLPNESQVFSDCFSESCKTLYGLTNYNHHNF